MTASLIGLATLEGMIDGNTFSGDEVSFEDTNPDIADDQPGGMGGLDVEGTFTGTFEGAFYGNLAAEAGGVFDFGSKDNEDGAFRGAFGGGQ